MIDYLQIVMCLLIFAASAPPASFSLGTDEVNEVRDSSGSKESSELFALDSLARDQAVPLDAVARSFEMLDKKGISDSFWMGVRRVARIDTTYLFIEQGSVDKSFYAATLLFRAEDSLVLINFHVPQTGAPKSAHMTVRKVGAARSAEILSQIDISFSRMKFPRVLHSQMSISPEFFAYVRISGTTTIHRTLLYMTTPAQIDDFASLVRCFTYWLAGSPAYRQFRENGKWPRRYENLNESDSLAVHK